MRTNKIIEIVAGPNGSGKSTFGEVYFTALGESKIYLNPDLIAAGISLAGPGVAAIQAGRILISEVKNRIKAGESFCFESTLSGITWAPILSEARRLGYSIRIYYLYLNRIEKNLARIKKRVRMGGHNIPDEAVIRRHPRCFRNFWDIYRPICDDWSVFDNTGAQPRLKMTKEQFDLLTAGQQKKFHNEFLRGFNHDKE